MKPRHAGLLITALSGLAVALLLWLIYGFELDEKSWELAFLPAFNASCNALSASLVVAALIAVKRQRFRLHGGLMTGALLASALFLVGYLVHHALHGDTRFTGTGFIRPVYFALLISHVLLSIVALPLVLNTVYFAATRQWSLHRRLARWTYPIWLYVSVTGVLVFFFLRVWFV